MEENNEIEEMVVFGGWNNEKRFNDFYTLDLSQQPPLWEEVPQEGSLPPVCDHSAVLIKDDLYVFGKWKLKKMTE